ncbi:hypothetical protein KI387_035316, partial [Taxus chinensis]
EIGFTVIKSRPHLESKVPHTFPSAIHYVGKLVDLVLEDEPLCMPMPKDPTQEAEQEKASVMWKIASYEGLLQALQEELKKADQDLNMYMAPEVLINIKTLEENNEFQKMMRDEKLGCAERLLMVKNKHKALPTAPKPHKTRLEELGKLIVQKMDLLEGRMTAMSSIVLVLQNEKGEIVRDELESIVVDIPKKLEEALTGWQALEAERKQEYLELVVQTEEETAG